MEKIKKMQMKMDNRGFSLTELMMVLAVILCLIVIMFRPMLKYLDQTRVSADTQVADNVRVAIMTAMIDPSVDSTTLPKIPKKEEAITVDESMLTLSGAKEGMITFGRAAQDVMGADAETVMKKLRSKDYKGGAITYEIADSGQVIVRLRPNAQSSAEMIELK